MKVARSPEYQCKVDVPPDEVKWPANCCICLDPRQAMKETLCTGFIPGVLGYGQQWMFRKVTTKTLVPYCDRCFHKTEKSSSVKKKAWK
jgi:hypothetical protein